MKRKVNGIYLALVVLLAQVVVGVSLRGVRAQETNRIGLVVRFGDGSLITRCIEFGESEISGYDVLMRSGLTVVAAYDSGQGTAICKIEHEGCPAEACLTCAYPNYWSYWHLVNGDWAYSQVGAGGHTVHPGDVEGWSWGTGDPPPVVSFDQICAPPPTNTPPPTDTPPLPTDTPSPPTATPLPTGTSLPPTATAPPVMPTATSPPPTPMVWFRLDENPVPAGACTTLRWDTDNALEIYLDGERVSTDSSWEVCPTAPQEYQLRVVSVGGEQTYTLVLGVTGTSPSPTFTPQPVATLLPSPSLTLQPVTTPSPSSSPTSQPVAILSPSPSSTPSPPTFPSPTLSSPTPTLSTPSPQPTPSPSLVSNLLQPTTTSHHPAISNQQPASSDEGPTSTLPFGYIAFGLITIGLVSWLIFGTLHRR